MIRKYFVNLSTGRLILWCYFIWYLVMAVQYFDPSPRLWLTSLGISLIIGPALRISASAPTNGLIRLDRWQTGRLFLIPFFVSSFSALIKGQGFFLIFSPRWFNDLLAVLLCLWFWLAVIGLRHAARKQNSGPG